MSRLLEEVVATYVARSSEAKSFGRGAVYSAEKMIEDQIVSEIVSDRIEEINSEVRRRERERAAVQELDEFRTVLFQCVTLALVVGVLGSHVYGLLEAFFYQPNSEVNRPVLVFGLAVLLVATAAILYKEYLSKLFEAVKKFRKARKELLNER